ncbi:hypothetical protein Bca52824_057969 [Brassica carinata]|uniref:Uncharacterized protein n=1 Tax=Brassica carinata TaxID=52824 RepID=A0A8X7UEA4_BRACI|nr:hypothetical protein Bca52824_057969 [Brassica carinata]
MEEKGVIEETVEEPLAVIVTLVAVLTEVALVTDQFEAPKLSSLKLRTRWAGLDVVSGENYGRLVPNWEWAYEGSKNETFRVLEPELNGDDVDYVGITEKWDSGYGSFKWFRRTIHKDYYEKKLCRNINAQNSWLYVSGMAFNVVAIVIQDFDAVARDPSMFSFFPPYPLSEAQCKFNNICLCQYNPSQLFT